MPRQTDALVIGAGPAGLATALALNAKGASVVVVDQKKPDIDKACGEGLMPDALDCLALLGISIGAQDSASFHGIRFLDSRCSVAARFGHGVGLGVRRTTLHQKMVQQANLVGVKIVWERKPIVLSSRSVQIGDELFETKWLIGADGQVSPLREKFALDRYRKLDTRYGLRRHYRIKPWTDYVEVHWSDEGQLYITPVTSEQVCFAFVSRDARMTFDQALQSFPAVQERIGFAQTVGQDRGSLTTTRRLHSVYKDNFALIGDASGSVDAVTGEGMAMSFRQALALAEALTGGTLAQYERAHNEILKLPTVMASTLLLLDRYPRLREKALQALSGSPDAFSKMLSVHLGQAKLWQVACKEGPRLGWNLMRASI